MMKCPNCQHVRSPQDDPAIPQTTCPACGIVYAKYRPPEEIAKMVVSAYQSRKQAEKNRRNAWHGKALSTLGLDNKNILVCVLIECVCLIALLVFNIAFYSPGWVLFGVFLITFAVTGYIFHTKGISYLISSLSGLVFAVLVSAFITMTFNSVAAKIRGFDSADELGAATALGLTTQAQYKDHVAAQKAREAEEAALRREQLERSRKHLAEEAAKKAEEKARIATAKKLERAQKKEREGLSTKAHVICKQFVKERLFSPSTADIPLFRREVIRHGDVYTVRSSVDAQNYFGATIRSEWLCEVEYLGLDGINNVDARNWRLKIVMFADHSIGKSYPQQRR